MRELLGGSTACYRGGHRGTKCSLEEFRCSATYSSKTNISKGHCIDRRNLITGTAGP
jgi:hypothetical protein